MLKRLWNLIRGREPEATAPVRSSDIVLPRCFTCLHWSWLHATSGKCGLTKQHTGQRDTCERHSTLTERQNRLFAEADRLVKPEMNRPHAHRVRFAASSLANRLHLTKRFLKLALQALFTGKAELQFRYHDKNQPENH